MPQRILLADDHDGIRKRVRSALEVAGFEVCGEAVNGMDAIEKAKALQPDLIVLNRSMPVMDGLTAIPGIIKSAPRVRIVMFSVDEAEEFKREALRRGAHSYVAKSSPITILISEVGKLLGSEPAGQDYPR
jgi:two-component system, chemotaxis family, chemotaxis protein CheY